MDRMATLETGEGSTRRDSKVMTIATNYVLCHVTTTSKYPRPARPARPAAIGTGSCQWSDIQPNAP
ncbi:hypothetical protein IAQ61_006264 [Plenodomus lingam]|uniref:uncharacterized protein n=1 Tax=Leptosphaeria maculans TaxID=5022 RepID=UPI0033182C65|nr:hypothetical protein IAQ61_006264 [Plenodomus lingam]